MKTKVHIAKVYMKNCQVIKVIYEDDDWEGIYNDFLYNKPMLNFNDACIKTENVIAIVW
jgi:hypothetical protein